MRKTVERITYRTLKAEIRALLDRPGVVPGAEERIVEWLVKRGYDRWKATQPPEPPTFEEVRGMIKDDLLERIEKDESSFLDQKCFFCGRPALHMRCYQYVKGVKHKLVNPLYRCDDCFNAMKEQGE